jgi:hypothetical protein
MELPRLRDLVRDIKAAKWAVLADGKNWFYQFPISPDVGRFFGVRLGGPRGGRAHADAADGFLTVLCMGWSWAPYIAQTASAALVRGLGWAWLDNFIITAGTRSDASRKWGEFERRCRDVNAEIHGEGRELGTPIQRFECLGIDFDLAMGAHRLTAEWLRRWAESPEWKRVRRGGGTAREFAKVFGWLVWAAEVRGEGLCTVPSTLSFVSRLGRRLHDSDAWEEEVTISPSVRRELGAALTHFRSNAWIHGEAERDYAGELWSDASATEWSAVYARGRTLLAGSQGAIAGGSSRQIYFQELLAHTMGICDLPLEPGLIHCPIDNAAAVRALERGHGRGYAVNKLLAKGRQRAAARNIRPRYHWIPTRLQLADPFTRGYAIPLPGAYLYTPEELGAGPRRAAAGSLRYPFQGTAPRCV